MINKCNRGVEVQALLLERSGEKGGNTTLGGSDISQIPAEPVLPAAQPVTTVAPCSLERAGVQAGSGGGSEQHSRVLLLCR